MNYDLEERLGSVVELSKTTNAQIHSLDPIITAYQEEQAFMDEYRQMKSYNPKKWIRWFSRRSREKRKEDLEYQLGNMKEKYTSYQEMIEGFSGSLSEFEKEVNKAKQETSGLARPLLEKYKGLLELDEKGRKEFQRQYIHRIKEDMRTVIDKISRNSSIIQNAEAIIQGTIRLEEITKEEMDRSQQLHDNAMEFKRETGQLREYMDALQRMDYLVGEIELLKEYENGMKAHFSQTTSTLEKITASAQPEKQRMMPPPVQLPLQQDIPKPSEDTFSQKKQEYYSAINNDYKKAYKAQLEDFLNPYEAARNIDDRNVGTIAEILAGKYVLDGKKVWKWSERIEQIEKILQQGNGQRKDIERLSDIVNRNSYLKRKHKDHVEKINDLFSEPQPTYEQCELPAMKTQKGKVYRPSFRKKLWNYTKKVVLPIAAAATLMFSAGIGTKSHNPEPVQKHYLKGSIGFMNLEFNKFFVVEKGDNLWNMTKDYLGTDDKQIYKTVDRIAGINGKGRQSDYKIGQKDPRSPHYIKPGDIFIIPGGSL